VYILPVRAGEIIFVEDFFTGSVAGFWQSFGAIYLLFSNVHIYIYTPVALFMWLFVWP
jgi:hypothetical protein